MNRVGLQDAEFLEPPIQTDCRSGPICGLCRRRQRSEEFLLLATIMSESPWRLSILDHVSDRSLGSIPLDTVFD
eukprot:11326172-Prorocentrum_lima.AAC.1